MPSDTSVSIVEVPCLAFFSAARWNGHAHHRATGAAQATSSHCQPGEPQRRDQGQHQRQVGQRDEEDQRHDQPAAQVGGVPSPVVLSSVAPSSPGRTCLGPSPRAPLAVYPACSTAAISSATGIAAGAVTRAVAVA